MSSEPDLAAKYLFAQSDLFEFFLKLVSDYLVLLQLNITMRLKSSVSDIHLTVECEKNH